MPELVGSMSFGQSKVTTELLKMIGCKNDGESVSDSFVEKVAKCQSTVILLYRPLSASLQFALNQSKELESELTAWTDQAVCILKLAKSYRKHVLLFQEKLVSENPKAFIGQCQAKGLIDQAFDFESTSTSSKVSYVYDLVAAEIKRRHPAISRLESQLEALSIPLTEDVDQTPYDPLEVLAEHKQLRSRRDQLKRELVQAQEKISSLSDKNVSLSDKLKQAELNVNTKSKDFLALEQQHKKLTAEHEKLKKQKSDLDKALENAKSDLLASHSLVEMNNHLVSQLNNRVGTLEGELSNGNSENAALLNQLHIVQETLESKIVALNESLDKNKTLSASLNTSETDLKTKQKRVEELNKKLKALELSSSDLQEQNKTVLKQLSAAKNEVKSISDKNKLLQSELDAAHQYSKRLSDQKNRLTKALSSVEEKLTEVTEAWSVSDLESARLSESLLAMQNEKSAWLTEKTLLHSENHSLKKMQEEQRILNTKLEEQRCKLAAFESDSQKHLEKLRTVETALKEKQKIVEDLELSLQNEKKLTKDLRTSVDSGFVKSVVSNNSTDLDKDSISLKNENTYLLEQLHSVQEELKGYFVKYSGAEKQEDRFVACLPSLLALLRKYPYTQLSRKNQMQIANTLFDSKWYLSTYLDVAQNPTSAKDPFSHFLHHGFFEGRNPNADLNTMAFIRSYPEVLSSDRHPLLLCVERLNQN
ncbi:MULTISPECIES: hypothetical protein [Nitrincola]|uniref:ATPase involved in DNA repair n=1 Tax=Nitrincola nitratireducens TaxID=1229521 RepID=W9UTU3_9GAMM|nr:MULTISPECIES: hypothetical protein [Nitrincola]EXJ10648.1 ATPase involved in DNA repair [Nitrincola nitratireducens]